MAGTERGARPLGGDDGGGGRRRGLLPLILGLLAALILAAILVATCAGDDDEDEAGTTTPSAETQPADPPTDGATTPTPATGGAEAEDGETGAAGLPEGSTLIAGGQDLLAGATAQPDQVVGESALGTRVRVQDVVEGEGFFVGTLENPEDRVYVEFGGDVGEDEQGAAAFEARVGQLVDLEGEVRPAPEDPGQTLNIQDEEDIDNVEERGYFVNATEVMEVQG